MTENVNYITGRTSEFNEFRESVPVHLETGGFLLCTAGQGDVVIDSRQYRVKEHDLIVAFPHSYAQAIHTSEDFDGVIFGVDMDLLISTDLKNKSQYITSVTQNPCISLREEEAERIIMLRNRFLNENRNIEHPLRREIDQAALKIIIYEIAALFYHSKPNLERVRSRDDIIFNNFIIQLHNKENPCRSLESYAQRESITPSHLSKVVKRVSNRSASEWISQYTIVSIKQLLHNKELTVAEIAEMLQFPNASFLSQYFKRYTAQSPRAYRSKFLAKK